MGILRSGETRSKIIEELQIIPQELYDKAQGIMTKRSADAADTRTVPMYTDSRCLLNGKANCAHCGSRLIVATNGRFIVENGVKQKKLRYVCYGKRRKQTDCCGQTGYSAIRVDNSVDGAIRHIFECMRSVPRDEVVSSSLVALQKEQESRIKTAQRDYTKAEADLNELKGEVLKSIRGDSKFSSDLLSELIKETEFKLVEAEAVINRLKVELNDSKNQILEMQEMYDEVLTWTELYDSVDLAAKKMIIANLINRIEIGMDYAIHIDFKFDVKHFNIHFDFCSYTGEKSA